MSNIGCMHKEINLNIKKCNTMTIKNLWYRLQKNQVHQFFPLFNQKKLGTINHNLRSLLSHNHSSEVTLLAIQIFVTYYGIAMHVVSYLLLALSGAKRLLRLFPGCLTLNAYTKTHHFMWCVPCHFQLDHLLPNAHLGSLSAAR